MFCPPADDLSFQKVATQSSTWVGSRYDATFAVDGNTATCMRTLEIGLNSPSKNVWWKVDLGGLYSIYSVNLMFKNYDGHGIQFYIFAEIMTHCLGFFLSTDRRILFF